MAEKQKVLVCGEVKANFNNVFSRASSLNTKSGPFDLLLCTGNFFGQENDELEAFKNGGKIVAIPTYILGPCNPEQEALYPDDEGLEICPNVTYLGKRGLYTTSSGLKIAYLSGSQSAVAKAPDSSSSYTSADCCAVRDACFRGHPDYRGIDILITSEWPADIQNLDEKKLDLNIPSASMFVAWLALHIRPRYHFVASPKLYYERPPYRNHSKQHNTRELATRFIGLAPVGNSKKEKWMYACSLQPINRMRMMDLLQGTTDETPCPYDEGLLSQNTPGNIEKYTGNGQFFYDMDSSDSGGNKRRHKGDGNQRERKRPEFDQGTCWFCLSSPTVEKHLVISVGENCYLALAKGPLTPFHCLILPVAHHQATTQAPEEVTNEIKKFKSVLVDFFDSMEQLVVFYERNFKTSHLQIQCVPVPKNTESQLLEAFQDEAGIQGVKLDPLPAHSDLCQIAAPGTPYFHVQLPSGEQLFTRTRHTFPLQFGRDVLASSPILDCEDKADWRQCQLTKEEEIDFVKQFREKFEPYDFTVEED